MAIPIMPPLRHTEAATISNAPAMVRIKLLRKNGPSTMVKLYKMENGKMLKLYLCPNVH
jgi:hypothetical protein